MASLPKVRDGSLLQQTAQEMSFDPITIGTAEWYTWLEHHRSFSFEAPMCSFTARKERRPAGWYWYAVCIPTTLIVMIFWGWLERKMGWFSTEQTMTTNEQPQVMEILNKVNDIYENTCKKNIKE